jgi:hypothetical protein|tara:strand:- start:908 stop:1360 length:453 start_codon:yes stop_codon:yes gene_type:complete
VGKKDESPEPLPPPEPPSPPAADLGKRIGEKVEAYFRNARGGRMVSSSFAIAWSIVLLIFFNFFSGYIAYYHDGTRDPILTAGFYAWLPVLNTALIASIVGHIIMIIFDRYVLRQIALIVLNLFGLAAVATLLSLFPSDFSVIPGANIAG